ncbi:MAG: response regulator transcription factor [Tannerellaceae bacterium]|jgi:DNA-binding LytR/AlgR family response regulator|nr:response regulator transcription factor [Tannerellaceae bacterium]
MKCIAIDDEPLALKILSHYCERTPSIRLLGAYTDPLDGLLHVRSMQPELLFLDIRMPELSGIDIVNALGKELMVIFTTAHREYAVEGFELNVVDYLLKPFGFDRFLMAYAKAADRLRASQQKAAAEEHNPGAMLKFRCDYQNVRLPLSDILYIEGCNNYVKIICSNKTYMPVMTMKRLLNLLPASEFIRVHKSFIIPLCRIKSFNHETVVTEKIRVPLGRTFRKDFLEKMLILKGQP